MDLHSVVYFSNQPTCIAANSGVCWCIHVANVRKKYATLRKASGLIACYFAMTFRKCCMTSGKSRVYGVTLSTVAYIREDIL